MSVMFGVLPGGENAVLGRGFVGSEGGGVFMVRGSEQDLRVL